MYDYLDLRQTERLKELVPYKVLAPDADEIIKELERLNNIINELENKILVKLNRYYGEKDYRISHYDLEELLDKLKELKEGNKDEETN